MHRHSLSETGDMPSSVRSSRAPSFTSDRASVASAVTFQMPAVVRPPPAYIAAAVASQTITDHLDVELQRDPEESNDSDNAVFSEPALALLNGFLDHLLFAFLSTARSPSLTAIRPAISDVLKPRLAREATEAADEELQGLLAGEDEEQEFPTHDDRPAAKWDVEKVWKRTRLRVMVYTRLGELEDEDEERFVQQERRLTMDEEEEDEANLVSWASAIFLTSVIEYVAEQTLLVSGTAAHTRMTARLRKQERHSEGTDEQEFERLVVEEPDVEKIALNSALGRLWRTWRKRVRSPQSPLSPRGVRPVSSYASLHQRKLSHDTIDESLRHEAIPIPEQEPTETEIAANIPLPLGDNDINEIEVPGLARTFEIDTESSGTQTPVPRALRPTSVIMLAPAVPGQRRNTKTRPVSMPPLAATPFEDAIAVASPEAETPFETPMEQLPVRQSYIEPKSLGDFDQQRNLPSQSLGESEEPNQADSDVDMVAFAATTGMGFRTNEVDAITTDVTNATTGEHDIPSATSHESEPKIFQSKRMSIEKTGPPGVIRTFSTRSSSLRSTPTVTPRAMQRAEGTSYLDDAHSEDEAEDPATIGVARTSDVPVRFTPSPQLEPVAEKAKHAAQGGYVELHPRQTAPASISVRDAPALDEKPTVPERSTARKGSLGSDVHSDEVATVPSPPVNIVPSPQNLAAAPPKPRGSSLPSLQEIETQPNTTKQRITQGSASSPREPSHQSFSPKRSPGYPSHDASSLAPEPKLYRQSTEDSVQLPGSPSSPTLHRVISSSSSSKRSGSFVLKPSGREVEGTQRPRGLSGRMSEEDRERQFDSLVKGQETVKYTLTPQNMRDLDVGSPTGSATSFFKDGQDSPALRREGSTRTATGAVSAKPKVNTERAAPSTASSGSSRTIPRSNGPVAPQYKSSPSRKVITRPLAREPRIETESMRDFADFIRSTGPSPGNEQPVKPFVNISGGGTMTPNGSSNSLGRKPSLTQNSVRNGAGPTAKPRINMQPRSPAGLSNGNDDLIDFIRQGPPGANGQPRIPRSVAPFRSTVDSDQFENMLGENNVDLGDDSKNSTASTLNSKHSMQTVNSRTGLLPDPKVAQPAYSSTPQNLSGNMSSAPEPQVMRKVHRNKDPYAIDESDDEDGDTLTALPRSNHTTQAPKQESLMDFLNGMDPPSNNQPQPFMLSEATIAAAKARANAAGSAQGLSSTQNATRGGASPATWGSVSSTIASDAPRAYKPRLQARAPAVEDVRGGRTGTSDLADFLRNSGPPEPRAAVPSVVKGEEKKSRKFWRKKTPAV